MTEPAGPHSTTIQDPAWEGRYQRNAFIVMTVFFLAAPFFIYPVFLMKALCFALFACAFNLLIGFGGLLSFGHAMFLGMAGYVAAHTAKIGLKFTIPLLQYAVNLPPFTPELAILAGAAVATVLGLLTGLLAIKRQGIYFAMITLALAQMVFFFCLQAPFTGGEDGIQSVPRGMLFGLIDLHDTKAMYYTVLAVFTAGFLLIYRIIHSPYGQVLKAIRENEPRAISLGYRTERYKLMAFVLSAGLAGLAGATKAIVFQLASLTDVHWSMSGEVVLMTLLGGMGTVFGPIVGAFIIAGMESYLADAAAWVQAIPVEMAGLTHARDFLAFLLREVTIAQGIIFVFCVLAFRRGIMGELEAWLRHRRK